MAGMDEDALMAGLGENALRGYEMDKQAKMERERMEAEMEAEKEFEEKQNAEMQKQNMNAMIEMLLQMRSNFEQLSADIRAPKVIDVKRNPQTGLIEQAIAKVQ
jgi:uncharacterized protein YaiL (DUF2058 family)